jgi:hypothetical protein
MPDERAKLRDWVAVILAIGICTAVNLLTMGVLYDAIRSEGPGLSENATQVMTTAFGGIIGVLGAYLGFRAGQGELGGNANAIQGAQGEGPQALEDSERQDRQTGGQLDQ